MDRVTGMLGLLGPHGLPGLFAASRGRLWVLGALALSAAAAGCTPKIGDKCVLSTDCSQEGTLVCDTSQPDGYCTQLNCTNGSCPNDAVCVEFQSSVPGCMYKDYESPSRTGRSFCMAHCGDNSDCRQSEGYGCGDPRGAPWNAAILDNNQSQRVCIIGPGPLSEAGSAPDAAVCMSYAVSDAGPGPRATVPDASAADGGADAGDAGAEAGDAGAELGDAGADAEVDGASDSGFDATLDAPTDTGAADAPGGG